MLYPKITRYNYRRRGPVESRKKIAQQNSINNAIKELKDNLPLLTNKLNDIKNYYNSYSRNIVISSIRNLEDFINE